MSNICVFITTHMSTNISVVGVASVSNGMPSPKTYCLTFQQRGNSSMADTHTSLLPKLKQKKVCFSFHYDGPPTSMLSHKEFTRSYISMPNISCVNKPLMWFNGCGSCRCKPTLPTAVQSESTQTVLSVC